MNSDIINELVEGLIKLFDQGLQEIKLYGSVARQTQTEESDIDIAVFLNSPLDPVTDDKLSEFIVDMNLKYDRVFSVIDIDCAHFDKWVDVIPFYNNVEKEGVTLWKAA